MLFINAVDGCSYLIKKDSINYVKKDGDKIFFYVKQIEKPIVSSNFVTEDLRQYIDLKELFVYLSHFKEISKMSAK